jgi:hypothetical protein
MLSPASSGGDRLRTGILATHSYVIIESSALTQRRLGSKAAERLHEGLLPAVRTHVVDQRIHDAAVTTWRAARSRRLSLVDATSFVVMRLYRIQRVLPSTLTSPLKASSSNNDGRPAFAQSRLRRASSMAMSITSTWSSALSSFTPSSIIT